MASVDHGFEEMWFKTLSDQVDDLLGVGDVCVGQLQYEFLYPVALMRGLSGEGLPLKRFPDQEIVRTTTKPSAAALPILAPRRLAKDSKAISDRS